MKLAIVSTYPPRPCGIATFSADLQSAIRQADPGVDVSVISIVADQPATDRPGVAGRKRTGISGHPAEVTRQLQQAAPHDYVAVARELNGNGTDVVLIEHEFGIFGGEAGDYVLALAAALEVAMVVTLHTVLSTPSEQQAATLRRLCESAALVTVFTETASRMVVEAGIVSADRVRLVPHGAPPLIVARELAPTADGGRTVAYAASSGSGPALVGGTDLTLRRLRGRRVLSTFGLISSGKGIETAIRAVDQVVARHPDVLYLIAGQTHPEVAKREGESYRQELENLVGELSLQQHVHFLDRFLTVDELALLLSSTDLYLTPYRSREQIVSGALTFAVAAGCPVVSTPYLYAEDLLNTGAGVLVPFDDPGAMAGAINALLDDPDALAAARAESSRIGARLSWNSVAAQTVRVLREAVRRPAQPGRPDSVAHAALLSVRPDQLLALTDDVGIIQHADGVIPRYDSGYCIDDAARMVLVGLGLDGRLPERRAQRMVRGGLALLAHGFDPRVPGMHNFMSYDRRWLDGPHEGDHAGRTAWALGEVVGARPPSGEDRPSLRQLESMEPLLGLTASPRTIAFALLGLVRPTPDQLPHTLNQLLRTMADRLMEAYDRHATKTWRWFEPYLTYDNARLPQALIAAGARLDDAEVLDCGLATLDWYLDQCREDGELRLIGNQWREQGDRPASSDGDEQPLDATAVVEATLEAWRVTGRPQYRAAAKVAFEWFLGRNRLGVPVYDADSGGGHDGLTSSGLNDNQGAESTLAFWQAALAMERAGLRGISIEF